jgi:Pectinacetylesterase
VRRIVLGVLGVLGIAVGYGGDDGRSAVRSTTQDWQRVEPGGATRCARGGPYAFWLRKGDPEKLLVFFQGGGGCFDVTTCQPGSRWFDDRVDAVDDPGASGGVLDLFDSRNPFRDYSMVYIPSCTGDVHTGTRVVRYGRYRVQQKGYFNARAALARAFREFPSATQVFITGCSAGSVGSAFHADAVLRRYPKARVTQVGDSLAFVFHRPVNLSGWGTHSRFPAWFEPRRPNGRWTMVEFLTALAKRYPMQTFARFNHVADGVQEAFYAAVGGDPGEFPRKLRAAERALKRLPNYRSYLACGTTHCSFDRSWFYSEAMSGVALRDWVTGLARGKDVSCPTCPR